VQVLLEEKHFEGAGGLELTDEVRVTIAAHAALLLLRSGPDEADYFPGLVTVLVYPGAYRAPTAEHRDGIVSEGDEARLGESWHRGVVVLAWDAARAGARDARDGQNVILHEFAHQLDTADGAADGVPPLDGRSQYRARASSTGTERRARRSSSPSRPRRSSRSRGRRGRGIRRSTPSCATSTAWTPRETRTGPTRPRRL
jgi:Mlc titration factor MtfA (ptsG expression regulator)